MSKTPYVSLVGWLLLGVALTGCSGGGGAFGSGGSGSGDTPVVLAVTDTPPTDVSILAAQVTLTGATLTPGNVSLLSGPAPALELTRLQTDIAYLGTTLVSAGTYTNLTLTFSAPVLTFENNTGAPLVTGVGTPTPTCASGAICTIQAVATNLTATIPLGPLVLSGSNATGLLMDLNLGDLLLSSPPLGADFQGGVTVSQFTPSASGAFAEGAEDVLGRVTAVNTVQNSFTFQSMSGSLSLVADSSSLFLQFPSSVCSTQGFACLRAGQILSVDIGFGSDGTPLARNVLFEDLDSTLTEVEGIVTGLGAQSFTIVTLAESATVAGLAIGDPATVNYTIATSFNKDLAHADGTVIDTTGLLFDSATDLFVGQQVLVRRAAGSAGTVINADRVRLRSLRITGRVQALFPPIFNLGGSPEFPSLFTSRGIGQIQVRTDPNATIFAGNAMNINQILVTNVVSARGMLFSISGSPLVVATKVLKH